MASPSSPTPATQDASPWSIGRIAAVMAALAIALFWIWVFAGGPKKDNPDKLQDQAYVDALEDRCQQLRADIGDLTPSKDTPDNVERAAVVVQANELVAAFIDDVAASAPTEGDAARSMEGWLADWRIYLIDREDYAERLATDPEARLLLDESQLGDPVDKTIEIFAQVNGISDCATPGDLS